MPRLIARIVLALGTSFLVLALTTISQGQAIPFQGLLTDNVGTPLDGAYDLQFTLYDAVSAGSAVGSTINVGDISIVGGIVNTELDFGDAFWSEDRWLQVGVRDGASAGAYDLIDPRTPILWSPRATTANRLGNLIGFENLPFPGIDFRSENDMRFHLDDDNDNGFEWFTVFDGSGNSLLRLQEGSSGDGTVQLPASSVSPAETFAESGIVHTIGSTVGSPTTGIVNNVASATLTLPTSGYVIAVAQANFHMTGPTATTLAVALGTTVMPLENTHPYVASDTWMPVSHTTVFSTTAGAKTFNFLVIEDSGTLGVYDPRLLLTFIPTGYGTVATASPPPIDGEVTGGLSAAGVSADRAASIEANQLRIERELVEVKEQLNAIRSENRKDEVNR